MATALVLAGPTAVGKSRVAARLAECCQGEVISADSVQAYRGLDVGSGTPSAEERRGVPHHLLSVLDPISREFWSASNFLARASSLLPSISRAGNTPIVAGGTGFYLQWLLRGSPGAPAPSASTEYAVRERIERANRSAELSEHADAWDLSLQELSDAGDPSASTLLHRNDWYRLQRRLAIVLESGLPAETFGHNLGYGTQPPEDISFRCFVLYKPRVELYRSIDERCELIVRDGLLSESLWLLRNGLQPGDSPATRAIGYRQAMEFLQWASQRPPEHACTTSDILEFVQRFQRESRNYAKRQLNWFRSKHASEFQWIDARSSLDSVVDTLLESAFRHQSTASGFDNGPLAQSERLTKDMKKELKEYEPQRKVLSDYELIRLRDWLLQQFEH
jgi:tRNA dimethylallyltransferase